MQAKRSVLWLSLGIMALGVGVAASRAEEADDETKKFRFSVEAEGLDLPVVEGMMIMATNIGPSVQYTFISTVAATTMTVAEVGKDEIGEFEPYRFSVMFLKASINCTYAAAAGQGTVSLKVEEADGGVRGELEGEFECHPLKGDTEGWPKAARVEGWYRR